MGLRTKFNLVILVTFIIGMISAGLISNSVLQKNARQEILDTAGLLMESAMAIRSYTVKEIRPLLAVQIKREFLPQIVPAYAAMTNVQNMREKYPEYSYKEATLNPTNPADRATDWEAGIIDYFRNNRKQTELIGTRESATGPMLYMARPIEIKNASCLACHSEVDAAPKSMLEKYGNANGFGWKMHEIIGSQIVSVPMSVPLQRASKTFHTFMYALAGVFVLVFVILNALLHLIVIEPVKKISAVAHEVSMGKMDVPELDEQGKDEIASLAGSFNRMRRSLVNALQMLGD